MKQIEIEHRARFSKNKYEALARLLTRSRHARDLGRDDKRAWFFVMPDKLLKVTHDISKKRGKISLKLTKIGKGNHFEEIEFYIEESSIESAVHLFTLLGHKYLFEPKILRHNYAYKGVELALKYSKTWGYHLELEVVVHSLRGKPVAEKRIAHVAEELGVKLMSEKELWEFTQRIEKTYKNPI